MLKSGIALLCALLPLISNGALAETESVCLLKDPPNQCGGFCLSVLTPVLNHLTLPKDQRNTSEANKANEVLVRQYTMESQLSSLENQQTILGINQQNLTERHDDLKRQLSALQETLSRVETKIKYVGFEQIGSKYFYIEKYSEKNWSSASKTCRQMGGNLADIKDEQELIDLQANLKGDTHYWLGINDLFNKSDYLSIATGKPAPFLKWAIGSPTQLNTNNCIFLYNGGMYDYSCSYKFRFICQTE
ncbi:accessory gland protein Acp29AB-like [Drosophila rhopaloa]|uniref:C-type lectin domain-containing protein n=1 Tax=Drosophila rhopaloa TaxID=1041015 RepID=A0ABM5H8B4_DRORH|nr:accessory gland protein Acp29AB-like [Drosophila rhopaloa]